MRIISGFLKGREVLGYDLVGTRPTMDRVKESVFGMIQGYLKDAICLDLFAGSGNLGFEAISNGATTCYFIDNNKNSLKKIKENANNFNLTKEVELFNSDYNLALKKLATSKIKFNIVFLDPPYKELIILDVCAKLIALDLLANDSVVVAEMEDNYIGDINPSGLILLKSRKYGSKYVNVYKYTK
ncbi:MAG: 16S rRNA (guanine(966)-N(2))-methyltransferase RsmD [Bacilli bacterium]